MTAIRRKSGDNVVSGGYHDLLDVVGGHVAVLALETLRSKTLRRDELSRRIPPSSRRGLDETLDGLVSFGLVDVVGDPDAPSYRLTSVGRSALHPLCALRVWAMTSHSHATAYVDARENLVRRRIIRA